MEEPDSARFDASTKVNSNISEALEKSLEHLLSLRANEVFWTGKLSSSALSTAVASIALCLAGAAEDRILVSKGIGWISATQNSDGGWGDTIDSPSNLSTSLLSYCCLKLAKAENSQSAKDAERYISQHVRDSDDSVADAIQRIYGDDRTFAVPILSVCALAGVVDWKSVPSLPFELALLPFSMYKAVRLQVVSYALPALIAVGMLIANKKRLSAPVRKLHALLIPRLMRKLAAIQPEHGGFLEAAPLTGFVGASLAACGYTGCGVLDKCLEFLREGVREDGSWPIDTNLSMWVTSNAVSALKKCGVDCSNAAEWIARGQFTKVHAFTNAAPGGWAWTDLPGGVPDADDTAGALRAVAGTEYGDAAAGVNWLLDLQNADGGWPTFCRGWGKLPFDQSSPDITAHALRALNIHKKFETTRVKAAIDRGLKYLKNSSREDGSWVPLWFGCQSADDKFSPVYGTARVLQALGELEEEEEEDQLSIAGVDYLLGAENIDGGWGGSAGCGSTVEETAVAVIALSGYTRNEYARQAAGRGADYLARRVADGSWVDCSPMGLYFASLWYSEEMYPAAWTVEALACALESAEE